MPGIAGAIPCGNSTNGTASVSAPVGEMRCATIDGSVVPICSARSGCAARTPPGRCRCRTPATGSRACRSTAPAGRCRTCRCCAPRSSGERRKPLRVSSHLPVSGSGAKRFAMTRNDAPLEATAGVSTGIGNSPTLVCVSASEVRRRISSGLPSPLRTPPTCSRAPRSLLVSRIVVPGAVVTLSSRTMPAPGAIQVVSLTLTVMACPLAVSFVLATMVSTPLRGRRERPRRHRDRLEGGDAARMP